ncbi:hypothetical protein FRB90_004114 [Tulasnella sp. 427]|nr:hypothetical protein FRB90_004114 [Tulasnella sp. 427]
MPLPPPPPQSNYSRSLFRNNLNGETAYQRHQRYVRSAQLYGDSHISGEGSSAKRNDFDVLKATHKFLRDEDDDDDEANLSYDEKVALKYYRSLFKEFAVCDLKHYKTGNVSLRWRTEDEVVSGAGQFSCGNSRCKWHSAEAVEDSSKPPTLLTLEVPFGYVEHGEAKSALVKLVLCSKCKGKLTWKRDQEKAAAAEAVAVTGASRGEEDVDGGSEEEEGPVLPPPDTTRSEERRRPRRQSRSRSGDRSSDRRRRDRHQETSTRRSASPPPRRQRP